MLLSLFPFLCVNLLVSWLSIHFWQEWLKFSVDGKSQAVGFIFFSACLLQIAPTSRLLGFLAAFHCHLLPSLPSTTSAMASLQPWNESQELTRDSRAAMHVSGLFLWVCVRNGIGGCFFFVVVTIPKENPSFSKGNDSFLDDRDCGSLEVSGSKEGFFPSSVFP